MTRSSSAPPSTAPADAPPTREKVFRDLIAKDPLDASALNYLGYMLAEHGTARSTRR